MKKTSCPAVAPICRYSVWVCVWLLLCALLANGCKTQHSELTPVNMPGRLNPAQNTAYPVVDTQGLVLEPLSDVRFKAGEPATLVLTLRNATRDRKFYLEEWRMNDSLNFTVFYRKAPDNRPLNDSDRWSSYEKPLQEGYYPILSALHLNPGNTAMLEIELPFIGELEKPASPASYEVVVRTRQKSISLASAPFTMMID